MDILLAIIGMVLMLMGVIEVIRRFVFWVMKTETSEGFTIVVTPEDGESCEYLLRSAAEKMRWLDLKVPCSLVCFNRQNDAEIDSICAALSTQYPFLTVSKPGELEYTIGEEPLPGTAEALPVPED